MPHRFSLRTKTLLLLTGFGLPFAMLTHALQRQTLLPSFDSIEQDLAKEDLHRARAALQREIDHVAKLCFDWAGWDDTYQFIVDGNKTYQEVNLSAAAFSEEAGVFNAIFYVDKTGRVVWQQARSPLPPHDVIEIDGLAVQRWPLTHPLLRPTRPTQGATGLIGTPYGCLMLGSHVITDTRRTATPNGWLVMGLFLTPARVQQIAEQTGVPLRVHELSRGQVTAASDAAALARLTAGDDIVVTPVSPQRNLGYALLDDIANRPLLMLCTDLDREVTLQGEHAIGMSLAATVASVATLLLILFFGLQRLVVGPITELTSHAARVAATDNLQARLGSTRTDEMGTLARQFDTMVEQLAGSRSTLVEAARRGGMSEIATSILHNVGNALNSAGVSRETLERDLLLLEPATLDRLATLLDEHTHDLGNFIIHDNTGRALPRLLSRLVTDLARKQASARVELTHLGSILDHLKTLIAAQQSFTGASGVAESTDVGDILDQAIRIASAKSPAAAIVLRRSVEPRGLCLTLQRHRVLEVLVNLLANAIEATLAAGKTDAEITVQAVHTDRGHLRVEVTDRGVGFEREVHGRLFRFGFTTKPNGHGFGLHACANVVKELGGTIEACSDGPGAGARFTIEIPDGTAATVATAGREHPGVPRFGTAAPPLPSSNSAATS